MLQNGACLHRPQRGREAQLVRIFGDAKESNEEV